MNLYHWENAPRTNRTKAKKAGTVVFHVDEAVDLSLDRLQKEYPLERTERADPHKGEDEKDTYKRAPLMTAATAKAMVKKMGFSALLPCQAQCYRGIFNRRDVILHSRTGSGKTLAYALPIIERHMILESHTATTDPFLLIFVFSNDLAVQTKGVLGKIYPKLHIGVAGFEDLASQQWDIVIGTVCSIDEVIRGKQLSGGRGGLKRKRTSEGLKEEEEEDDEGEEEEEDINHDDDNGEKLQGSGASVVGVVNASNVRAIVVDEVDLTLGPRFSNVGRRMRNLLRFIRRANGSLQKDLMVDFRFHHYVLCGATIPNWVVKAGFLGVKKYYYQLVTVGTAKLPEKLDCFVMHCPQQSRVGTVVDLLATEEFGRTVVFGTRKQIAELEVALSAKKLGFSFRTLTPLKDELDRIAAMEDFNSKTASVILCTDLAGRGLDFVDVHMVLMMSIPSHNMAVETFVHRAGRTARVSRNGRCLQLYDKNDEDALEAIRKSVHVVLRNYIPTGSKGGHGGLKESTDSRKESLSAAAGAGKRVTFSLMVRNPFKYTNPMAVVPSALDVLKNNLGELFLNASKITEENSRETVTFEYPAGESHEVRQKLWKFALKEITPNHDE